MLKIEHMDLYYGAIHALHDICFEVNPGEIVTLIGANGAGKTSILHAISGLIPYRNGEVTFNGQHITKVPPHSLVAMGLVQVPEGRRVFSRMSVMENLDMGAFTNRDKEDQAKTLEKAAPAIALKRLVARQGMVRYTDAQGQTLTGGGVAGRVMLGSVVGVVGGLVVLVAFSGWDPRKATRGLVAGSWGAGATGQQQGAALQVLRLDSAPRSYVSLVRAAVIARIARNRLESDSATSTYQYGTAAQETIAATVLPRGAMVPRPVPTSVDDARHEMQAASTSAPDRAVVYAWERWQASLGYASAILTGRTVPRADTITGGTLTAEMVRSVLHPESASFRYGVQRAVALGIATFVMLSTDLPEFYWVLLTIFAVMQTNAVATQARAVQYAVGTWIGALAAVALSLVLPSVVLGVLAVALLAAGFAWMVRNYLIMCVAIAAAVVLLVGSPDGQYLQWAGLRALDCTVGALTAVAVSAFILRVRPHPELHVEQARDALLTTLARLRAGLADEHVDMAPVLASQASLQRALSNLRSDIQLTRDSDWATEQLAQLTDVNDRVIALGSVVVERAGSRSAEDRRSDEVLVSKGLDDAERRVRAIPVAAASPT